jgi:hypothetical protein
MTDENSKNLSSTRSIVQYLAINMQLEFTYIGGQLRTKTSCFDLDRVDPYQLPSYDLETMAGFTKDMKTAHRGA